MKAAVIGCGNISHFHIHAIQSNPAVQSIALCDANEKKLKERAGQYQIQKIYPDVDKLLDQEKPDVVHIVTPPHTHSEIALKALDRGVHVLVEKPMAMTTAQVDEMVQLADKKKVKLCVNHSALFTPVVTQALEIANSFAFGALVHAECFFGFDVARILQANSPDNTGPMSWYPDLKGHILEDLFPHPASIVLGLLRQYSNFTHVVKEFKKDGFADEMRLLIDSNKATAQINISLRTHPDKFMLNLYGTKKIVNVDIGNMSIVEQKMYKLPKAISRGVGSLSQSWQIFRNTVGLAVGVALKKADNAAGVGILIDKFYTAIEHDWPPPVSGEEGRMVVELAEKIWY